MATSSRVQITTKKAQYQGKYSYIEVTDLSSNTWVYFGKSTPLAHNLFTMVQLIDAIGWWHGQAIDSRDVNKYVQAIERQQDLLHDPMAFIKLNNAIMVGATINSVNMRLHER